jgi:hypothetical protein
LLPMTTATIAAEDFCASMLRLHDFPLARGL